ncbi:hypothetical protein [Streptomyces sp. NPDC058664]|uniref:hypothetical protein n=1 Tax=unclassified Streptomyces TaxID=2593676 RepID=UPI0036539B67
MCRFIDAEKATEDNPGGYPAALLCRVLALPRSTYYSRLAARPAAALRQAQEEDLVAEIREIHTASRGAPTAPRGSMPHYAEAAAGSAGGRWRRPCGSAASRASLDAGNAR